MKRLFLLLGILVSIVSLGAVEIVETELEKVSGEAIEFFNYEGPHEKIETDRQIRGIGAGLSDSIRNGVEGAVSRSGAFFDKYRILHIVAPAEEAGLNADIFIIEADAQVDHIDNIRRIISGYIQSFYSISQARADALSVFITYYNAIYRGDMEYLRGVYNQRVLKELDAEKVGMSRRYTEWPGQSQIIIPLTELAGEPALSAETLGGDDKVVEELRKQEDRGVEERKEVVELREEQLEEEKKQLEEEREKIQEREEAVTEEKEEEAASAQDTPLEGEVTADEEATATEEEVSVEKEEIAEKEQELAEREEKIAEERESIAEDQKEIIAKEEAEKRTQEEERIAEEEQPEAAARESSVESPFLMVDERNGSFFGTLVLVNEEGLISQRSTINTIRSRNFPLYQDTLYAIAGEDNPPRTVRLIALNSDTLEMVDESEVDLFSGSSLFLLDTSLYAVVNEDGEYYLGRFSLDLDLEARSQVEVARYTALMFLEDTILVQSPNGEIFKLDTEDLE